MNKLRTGLKFVGCLFGGAVCASILLLIVSLCVFGWHDSDRLLRFIAVANPIAGIAGAITGAVMFVRSGRRPAN